MARRPDVLISIGAEMTKGFAKTTKDVSKEISKIWKTVGNAKNKYSSLNKAKDSYNQKLGNIADNEVISKAKYEKRDADYKNKLDTSTTKKESFEAENKSLLGIKKESQLNDALSKKQQKINENKAKAIELQNEYNKVLHEGSIIYETDEKGNKKFHYTKDESGKKHRVYNIKEQRFSVDALQQQVLDKEAAFARHQKGGGTVTKEMQGGLKTVRVQLKQAKADAQALKNKLKDVNAEIKKDEGIVKKVENNRNQIKQLNKTIGQTKEDIRTNDEAWAYHQQVVAQKIQAIQDKIAEVCSKAKKLILGTIGKAVGTLFRIIGKQLKQLMSNMLAPFKKIRENLLDGKKLMNLIVQYGFGFRSLYYLVNKFKSGIKDGFTYMGSAISDVQEQLNKLQEVLYYVKSAAAAALQPLLNMLVTLKPLLERFVALFNKFATSLATFLATLTGQDYIYKATTDLDAYATALDKTTGSANDLNQALGAYDKLNVIGDDDKSSGSGSDFDTSGWFEKEDLDPDSWASKLAEAIQNAIEIVDFTAVGRMLGDKLKEAISNIPWETTTVNGEIKKGIEQLANEISTDFSTLLIGFFNTQDLGSQIGETIAHAMNVAVDFVNNFLTTIREDKTVIEAFGDFILDSINTALTTLDIEKIGATVRLMFNNIHDLTKKLIEELDSDSLADIISEFILTVFTELGNKIDIFITAAQKIIPAIIEGFAQALTQTPVDTTLSTSGNLIDADNVDLGSQVGDNIAEVIVAGMNVSLASMDATETGESIGTILANIPVDSLAESIKILAEKIWETVVTACNTWVEENPDTFFGILKTVMGVLTAYVAAKFTFKVIGNAITKKASEWVAQGGFSSLLNTIGTWITGTAIPWISGTAWPAISTFFSTILANAYLWITTVAVPWITGVAIPAIMGALGTIGTALVSAFSAIATFVAAAWPFILAIAIAALITVAIALLVEHWDEIKQWWNEKLAEFKEWWDNSWIKETLDKIGEWWKGIKEKIKEYWDKVKEWAKGKYDTFKEWLDKVKARFQEWSDAIKEKVQPIVDKFTSAFDSVKSRASAFKSAFVSVFSGIWGGVKRIINSILGGIESMANGVVRGVNRLIDAINSISIDVPDWVTDLVGIDTIGFNLSRVNEVSIPRLAQGAVIPPNKEFMAVLGDQSSGTNIEAPLDTIKQALAEVMAVYGGNTQPIILQLDGKTVAKVVWDENKKRYKQTGKNYAY